MKKQYSHSSSIHTTIETVKNTEFWTGTMVEMQKQEQKYGGSVKLARKVLRSLDAEGMARILYVQLKIGRSGVKFLQFIRHINGHFFNSPKILVPMEAYPFLWAMDELLEELARNESVKLPLFSERCLLYSTCLSGLNFDYKLDLEWENGFYLINLGTHRREAKAWHIQAFYFQMSVMEFYWLRHRMGEFLAEFDGSQPVDVPPKFPGHWLSMDGCPRSSQPVQVQGQLSLIRRLKLEKRENEQKINQLKAQLNSHRMFSIGLLSLLIFGLVGLLFKKLLFG